MIAKVQAALGAGWAAAPRRAGGRQGSASLVKEASAALRMNQNAVDRFEEPVARYLGINRTDGRCLDILDRRGPLPSAELAREARLITGSTTAMVDRLAGKGYVRRVRDPSDRRRVVVELTDECRSVLTELFGPWPRRGRPSSAPSPTRGSGSCATSCAPGPTSSNATRPGSRRCLPGPPGARRGRG